MRAHLQPASMEEGAIDGKNSRETATISDIINFNLPIGLLIDLFYSWRPYKAISIVLKLKHGIEYTIYGRCSQFTNYYCVGSVSWLKQQFKRLGLRRRGYCNPPRELMKLVIQVSCKGFCHCIVLQI